MCDTPIAHRATPVAKRVIGFDSGSGQAHAMEIALISDTHLAARAAPLDRNLAAARNFVAMHGIGITVHLGDITADGAIEPAQLRHARDQLAAWPGRLLCLPGNHDVGDNPGDNDHPPVTADRLNRYADLLGPDHWQVTADNWTLIGINAQLYGSDSAAEKCQDDWLAAVTAEVPGPVGVFVHKPLFRDGPDDTSRHHRYLPAAARDRLLAQLRRVDLRFVAAGHTHQARHHLVDGVEHIWVPSLAFTLPDSMQETIGEKIVAMTVLRLTPTSHQFELVVPAGLTQHCLLDLPGLYPALADRSRDTSSGS